MQGSKKVNFQAFRHCFCGWTTLHLQAVLYRNIAVFFSCGGTKKLLLQSVRCHCWIGSRRQKITLSYFRFLFPVEPTVFLAVSFSYSPDVSFGILALRGGIGEPSFSTCSACQASYALLHQELCLRICSVNRVMVLIHHRSKTDWSLLWRK